MMKKLLVGLVLVFTLITTGCSGGPLSKLDSTLDYAPFFFQGLVIAHKITQEQADTYKKGVTRLESIADTTKKCLDDNVVSDNSCYLTMKDDALAAVAEYYPASAEGEVGQYVSLVGDIIKLIVKKNTPSVGASASNEDVDKTLNQKIEKLDRLVKQGHE